MKILYLMHVSWGWIKQRPHFLAEKLAQDNEVTVYYPKYFQKNADLNKEEVNLNIKTFFCNGHFRKRIRKIWLFKQLYILFFRLQVKNIKQYGCIWITNSILYKFVEPYITNKQKLIYDCMDDDIEFPVIKSDKEAVEEILKLERRLVDRADLIYCSAKYLAEKLIKRTRCQRDKITLLNNAIELPDENLFTREYLSLPIDVSKKLELLKKCPNNLVYIGTISGWFDFDLIIKSIEKFKNQKLFLIGPTEIKIPSHPQIVFLDRMERKYIFQFMQYAGALIMPFQVTELIRSVNPVKLYEYLFADKPVIAPYYEETIPFEQYIYTYKEKTDFEKLLSSLNDGNLFPKCDKKEVKDFIRSNTWDNRYEVIKQNLESSL